MVLVHGVARDGPEARQGDGPGRKRAVKRRIDQGTPVGILAYSEGEPVGWCSVAPRAKYRKSLVQARPDDERENVWSLVCFFVKREFRGRGVFGALLAAAERHAKAKGATVLEAYPVDEDSPSYRFGCFLPAFEDARTRRHVVRLRLRKTR